MTRRGHWSPFRERAFFAFMVVAALALAFFFLSKNGRTPGAPAFGGFNIDDTREYLTRRPLDHAKRLELARYYLHMGMALSGQENSLDEGISDTDLKNHFQEELVKWEEMGNDVTALAEMLESDLPQFKEQFVTRERSLARTMFENAILLFRQSRALGAKLTPRDLYDLGTAYYKLGPEGYSAAAQFLEEAVAEGLVSTPALTFLGNVSAARGDFERAVALFKRAQEFNPDDPIIAFNLALAYKEVGRTEDAVQYFRSVVQAYGDRASLGEDELSIVLQSRLAMAWSLLKLEKYQEAVSELETVLEATPNSEEAHYWLGMAYFGLEQYSSARAHWLRAEKIHPGFRDAKERMAALPRES